jgi:hypothetical protein
MTGGVRLKELHQALLYGTIAVVRVTHGAPPDCKVISTEEHTRCDTYPCFSSYFLYGSQIVARQLGWCLAQKEAMMALSSLSVLLRCMVA